MWKKTLMVCGAALITSLALMGGKPYTHQKYFEHYEGTKTCLKCHRKEAEEFFHTVHYQWLGKAPDVVNADGKLLGKRDMINDFCTNPMANWIGIVRNSRGEILSKGCSQCHTGLGLLPSSKMTEAQLENIDCLICHASGYRRDLYQNADGSWRWKPILWKNQEGMDSVSKRISLPKRTMCLRCHAGSGGGPNFKRGDIEYTLHDCKADFDVHMGTNGGNMQCIACHRGEDHHLRGRGADLSASDDPQQPLSCDNSACHGKAPHLAAVLNYHAKRVYCTVCHIPEFAKKDPTDMFRDWSKPHYSAQKDKYGPTIKFEKDVTPVYAWFNGKTWVQLPGKPVRRLADGSVAMMLPQGSRSDPNARIYAFKVHRAEMPVLKKKKWIVPIVVEEFFANGKIDEAVRSAAQKMYGIQDAQYTWTRTTRYMGIFHEVQPAAKALTCLQCHGPKGRLDWKALGYQGDPMDKLFQSRTN